MATYIIVRTQFEAQHRYPDAPEEVAFLRNMHRHMFHVEVQIEVSHDDRELEFLLVKRDLDEVLAGRDAPKPTSWPDREYYGMPTLQNLSCEAVARLVRKYLKAKYPPTTSLPYRRIHVKVFEDGENGAYVTDDK
jgi:6-pyruvoyl-tetrahydropterin synthase